MKKIKVVSGVILSLLGVVNLSFGGTSCPPQDKIRPCFCSFDTERQLTVVICAGVNSSQLVYVTSVLKSMIIDRFMLLGAFRNPSQMNIYLQPALSDNDVEFDEYDEADAAPEVGLERLPKRWLSSLRVKVIEIRDSALSSCFLCDEPLFGQGDFLTTLIATKSGLNGQLCTSCNTKIAHVTTRELLRTPNLQTLDLSYNNLKVLAGLAFPEMKKLKTLVLSNNKISKIYDRAFESLTELTELDVSNNRLTSISRKMFRDSDSTLKSLDFSWNSIQVIPDNMFYNLRSLREIKLANNLLEVLPENSFARLPSLMERIDVKGNFLVCNCSLSWINKKLNKNTKLSGKCVAPTEVELHDVKANLASLQSC